MRVDTHAIARGAAQQLIDGNSERLALDVPQRLIDAAQGAREDWTAAIEGMTVDGLPMVSDAARILADQVRLDFLDCLAAGERAAFGDGLSKPDNSGVRVDLEEHPARLHQKGFEPGHFQVVP